ncbi:hypothetical protein DES49_1516 [Halospina denitrificans]|uniref:Uncharacterized protein n=1 Tax=Halospina denitrificans TaxID=332522 RepID=A0A4R7JT06_9GAMM|nr:hypothetical protein [Halospina denitrificans]TDT41432.1 hypothetical protein DES49_1516 [Halospina denitrificans]
MASSRTIQLHIGNAIPPANAKGTERIIALWQQIGTFFGDRPFQAQSGIKGSARAYRISLDSSSLLRAMEGARDGSQSFSDHRSAHIKDPANRVDAELAITVTSEDQALEEVESYQVATVFLQQLVMATNIIHPGAFQVLDARFTGEGAHRFEAQQYDARIFHGALRTATSNQWPELGEPALETVWTWLEKTGVAKADTAIRDINRVLFTLLKVAEQRHEYSARTVLMVMFQLEVLLDCRDSRNLEQLRNRAQLVLGDIPEAADCFTELHDVRNGLFLANQPVNRPPLICHNTAQALREQIGQHNTAVESGTALVLALLQDLIANDAQSYNFIESMFRE